MPQDSSNSFFQPTSSPMLRHPLLITSLGNPSPYASTFHSAGHVLLIALAAHLSYPPFARSRAHASGQVSRGQNALLWQSPTFMNVSGPAVASAWRTFLKELDLEARGRARLVIVHDELESPFGNIKVKKGGSAKGHNGLRSCIASLGGKEFWKVGVGIGRPTTRESKAVADYVLKKMSPKEIEAIQAGVDEVALALGKLSEGD